MSLGSGKNPSVLIDEDGNTVGVVLDGAVYRLAGLTKVVNASNAQINPATQETVATLATEAKLEAVRALVATIDADTSNLDVALSTRATEATLATRLSQATGASIETVLTAIRDTAGIKKITDALPAGTNNIGGVDVVSSALPTGAATEATLALIKNTDGIKKITDPVAVTDNAGSLTVDTPQLPAALVGARLDVNNGAWLGSTAPTVGQKAMASSLPIAIASDQSVVPIHGPAAEAAAALNNPVRVGGWDGANIRTLRTDAIGRLVPLDYPTFVLQATAVALGNNKSMVSLLNADASLIVKIREVRIVNVRTSTVTGTVADFRAFRITGHSAGTTLTPLEHDTADALDSDITARTGGTVSGEAANSLWRRLWSSDDWGAGALDVEAAQVGHQQMAPTWQTGMSQRPIVLRQNQGLSLKCVTNTTAGTFDINIVFTVE